MQCRYRRHLIWHNMFKLQDEHRVYFFSISIFSFVTCCFVCVLNFAVKKKWNVFARSVMIRNKIVLVKWTYLWLKKYDLNFLFLCRKIKWFVYGLSYFSLGVFFLIKFNALFDLALAVAVYVCAYRFSISIQI